MRKIALASLFVIGLTVAAPADARNWVRIGEGWVDRDSIRRAGNIVYFDMAGYIFHLEGVPPTIGLPDQPGVDETGDGDQWVRTEAYNCRTHLAGSVGQNGGIDPFFSFPVERDEAAVVSALLCHRPPAGPRRRRR